MQWQLTLPVNSQGVVTVIRYYIEKEGQSHVYSPSHYPMKYNVVVVEYFLALLHPHTELNREAKYFLLLCPEENLMVLDRIQLIFDPK